MKISKKAIFFFICILPFLEPELFKEYSMIDNVYSVLKVVFFGIIALKYFRDFKISPFFLIVLLFKGSLFLSTLLNHGSISSFFGPTISILSLVMLIEYHVRKGQLKMVLNVLTGILSCYLILNFITILFFENGVTLNENWSKVYFLGIENRFFFMIFPYLFFSFMKQILDDKRTLSFYLLMIISNFTLIYCWSVGGMIVAILYSCFLLLYRTKLIQKLKKLFSFRNLTILIVLFNLGIVVFQVQKYFEPFIVNVLKKDVTLTGRTLLWDGAMLGIRENPILGVGIQRHSYLQAVFPTIFHAHNLFLNITYESGLVGLCLFLLLLYFIGKETSKNQKLGLFFNLTLFFLFIMSLTDTLDSPIFFSIYAIIYFYCRNERGFEK